MTREGTRPIAALAIAIFVAVLLSACGGSDSTTGTTGTGSTEAAAPESGGTGEKGPSKEGTGSKTGGSGGQKSGSEGDKGNASGGSNGTSFAPKPLRVSGGGSAPFLTKGGDNSIQEYGEEGDESELTQAAETLHAFLVARANEDWAKTCFYLTKVEVQQLEQLGSRSPQLKGQGCPAVVKALGGGEPLSDAIRRELTEVDAASLRIEGDEAFLIYNGAQNTGYFVRMEDEGGSWKVGALSPTAFPGG